MEPATCDEQYFIHLKLGKQAPINFLLQVIKQNSICSFRRKGNENWRLITDLTLI
jgi:hypothetical protein